MFLMKINVASALHFAVNNECQWKSHKGSEGSHRAGRGRVSDAASLGAIPQAGSQQPLPWKERSFGTAQVTIPLVIWHYQAPLSFTSVPKLATGGQSQWPALQEGHAGGHCSHSPWQNHSAAQEIPSLRQCALCTAHYILPPWKLLQPLIQIVPCGNTLLPLPQPLLLLLQLLCCWPQHGGCRTTQECQQLCVLSNPGWMFSTYSLVFLWADYCLTFLGRQLEAPANFYDILKLHICLIYLLLPSPGLHASLAIHLFMLDA